jgi:hypothetical protein
MAPVECNLDEERRIDETICQCKLGHKAESTTTCFVCVKAPKSWTQPNVNIADYEEILVEGGHDVSHENLGDEPKSIIMSLLKQVGKGVDLHKIAFPTFVLEPRSILERLTDFMAHPQLISKTSLKDNAVERFIDVLKYFLSGWHIRPKGVKKPYNPVLGEIFRCRWKPLEQESGGIIDGSGAYFIAEQVSHHPPVSAYFYAYPEANIVATGNFRPKSKFLGNSVMSLMNGTNYVYFLNRPGEEYIISNPNIYARGILFGNMVMEIGDTATIKCLKSDLIAEIDFKTKGFFGGGHNQICGKIRRISTGECIFAIHGKWTDQMFISIHPSSLLNRYSESESRKFHSNVISIDRLDDRSVLFKLENDIQEFVTVNRLFDLHPDSRLILDVKQLPIASIYVPATALQQINESRFLWRAVTDALKKRNFEYAGVKKMEVEDIQRRDSELRSRKNTDWNPSIFKIFEDQQWFFLDRSSLLNPTKSVFERLLQARDSFLTLNSDFQKSGGGF